MNPISYGYEAISLSFRPRAAHKRAFRCRDGVLLLLLSLGIQDSAVIASQPGQEANLMIGVMRLFTRAILQKIPAVHAERLGN